jgi:hypothetical protein
MLWHSYTSRKLTGRLKQRADWLEVSAGELAEQRIRNGASIWGGVLGLDTFWVMPILHPKVKLGGVVSVPFREAIGSGKQMWRLVIEADNDP